jgi:F-type H+-transporting ATPase subunit alpha
MSELKINPNEIRDALKDFVSSFEPQGTDKQEVGYVIDAGDGIAHIEGLPSAMANELLRFSDGTLGLAPVSYTHLRAHET